MIIIKTRNTLQKSLILNAATTLAHPTAEDVYHYVTKIHPSIGRGTVYRNLKQLADSGELRRVMIPDAADRFDRTLCEHYHIRCRICGSVADSNFPYQSNIQDRLKDSNGYLVEGHHIVFVGVCPECRSNIPESIDSAPVN